MATGAPSPATMVSVRAQCVILWAPTFFTCSLAVRIVRTLVQAIGDAITIAVCARPGATIHVPAAITFLPCRLVVAVALTFAQPRALDPHMTFAAPVPVAGNPHVAAAWRGNELDARSRRCNSHDDGGRCRYCDADDRRRQH